MFKKILEDPKVFASILKDSGLLVLVGVLVYFGATTMTATIQQNTTAIEQLKASNETLIKSTDNMGSLLNQVLLNKRVSNNIINSIRQIVVASTSTTLK